MAESLPRENTKPTRWEESPRDVRWPTYKGGRDRIAQLHHQGESCSATRRAASVWPPAAKPRLAPSIHHQRPYPTRNWQSQWHTPIVPSTDLSRSGEPPDSATRRVSMGGPSWRESGGLANIVAPSATGSASASSLTKDHWAGCPQRTACPVQNRGTESGPIDPPPASISHQALAKPVAHARYAFHGLDSLG